MLWNIGNPYSYCPTRPRSRIARVANRNGDRLAVARLPRGPCGTESEDVSETGMMPVAATLLEAAVANAVGTQRYELWFRAHVRFVVTEAEVVVVARSAHLLDWLNSTFAGDLARVVNETLGSSKSIRYLADATAFQTEVVVEKAEKQQPGPKVNLFGETIQPPAAPPKIRSGSPREQCANAYG